MEDFESEVNAKIGDDIFIISLGKVLDYDGIGDKRK